MGIEQRVNEQVMRALAKLVTDGRLPPEVLHASFKVEQPRRAEHGHLATNAALAVQKLVGRPPRQLAELLAGELANNEDIERVEVAGPGFINLRLRPCAFHTIMAEVLAAGDGYGRALAATRDRVMVEFVSANPTGPLLVSHGRGAMVGDAVAALLEAAGHRVCREYYINDFGNQVRLFAGSVLAAARGKPPPEGGYGGGYVHELATSVARHHPELLAGEDEDGALARLCVTGMVDGVPGSPELGGIKATLARLGVYFDSWYSEEGLHRWGKVQRCLDELQVAGLLRDEDGALHMETMRFGDDKDRVVRKRDGTTTYFASDIAYQVDKFRRGFDRLVMVLGADHHGYEGRLRAGIRATGFDDTRFEILFFQLVSLLRDGKPYKMGKRLGNLITIDELVDEIDEAAQRRGAGADALRYFYLSRHYNAPIEIDIELAKKASVDNPVFYLQMGYARLCSIQRRARERFGLEVPAFSAQLGARILHPDELAILAQLGRFPEVIREAAETREPHRVVFYLGDLAMGFHSYFTRLKTEGDAILPLSSQTAATGWEATWDQDKSRARLLWVRAIQIVYGAGLRVLGISALERMDPLEPIEGTSGEEIQ